MKIKRTTIELDEELVERAQAATGGTLRATVEQGLRLVIDASAVAEDRKRAAIERHRRAALDGIDVDVLLSGEAWR